MFPVKKEEKLVNKIKRLLKRAKIPRWLHRKGPKMYEFWQHAFALLTKAMCKLSYRRTVKLMQHFGCKVASKSTLCYQAQRIPLRIWQLLLQATVGHVVSLGAIDATGLSGNNPSWHYIKRIDRKKPIKRFFQLSILIDVPRRKILSLRVRSKPRHDILDAKYLFKHTAQKPETILLDRGYDAEWLHQFFTDNNCKSIAPVRKNCRRGKHRKQMRDNFPQKIYGQRSLVECMFFALKQKYGGSLGSRRITSARAEVYCRAILHNIGAVLIVI